MALIVPALDFDGAYCAVTPDEEVDLHLVPVGFRIPSRIEEKRTPRQDETLRNGILGYHAAVEIHVPREYGFVEFAGRRAFVAERKCHQKPRVAHVELHCREIG